MCSNRTNLAFNRSNSSNQITKTSAQPFNAQQQQSSTKQSLEHVYYAKLVNFDRQKRVNKTQLNATDSATFLCREQEECYMNKLNEIDISRQRNRLRNVSKLNTKSNKISTSDYESLTNLDSGVDLRTKLPINEDSRSTSSCCSSSIEKIDEELEEELQDTNNTLKTNTKKLNEKRKYSNNSTVASSTTASFSSSSASSISSTLSSIAINNQSSSQSSSSSSSPSFLNNNYQTDSAHIYSSNYKVRNNKFKTNDLLLNSKQQQKQKDDSHASKISTPPAKPSTPPPQLLKNNDSLDNLLNSNSATITKTSKSSWLQSKQLNEIEATTAKDSIMNRHFSIDSNHVSTKANNKLLANKLLQYSLISAQLSKEETKQSRNFMQLVNDENLYCDLSDFNKLNIETTNALYRDKLEQQANVQDDETTTTEEIATEVKETQLTKTNKNYYYNSTLLTPLKPISSSEAKITLSNEAKTTTSQSTNANIKSASTSYLLSKITSIASLTMPKHNRTATTAVVESLFNNNSLTSPASTSSSSSQSASVNPLSNLATKTNKFFNRKQNDTTDAYLVSSQTSPYLLFNENCANNQLSMSPAANKYSCSSSSSSSSSYLVSNQGNTTLIASSSRRPFKKRSQSTHNNLINKITWYFNQTDDCWYKTIALTDSNSSSPKTFSSTLKKRKSLNNKIASVVATKSMSSFSNSDDVNQSISMTDSTNKVHLTQINIKHLTLVELKYLKQICFNKLQKQFQLLQLEQQKQRKQLLNKTSMTTTQKTLNTNNSFAVRVQIPKDESIKTTKTKSIALRSKSVDFKFFDEFKENYFPKKSSNKESSNQQVFGQSLYKCILNDLEQSSRRNSCISSTSSTKTTNSSLKPQSESSKSNTSLLKSNKKWRSSNQNNILIASKFDLNLLNEINANEAVQIEKTMEQSTISKRNSVLFEALDLKNMSQRTLMDLSVTKPNKNQLRSSSISTNLLPPFAEKKTTDEIIANNQNLSIRSEGLVPNIVKSCCDHISEYGLDVVGIFRIDSSKKRIKEIKEMFDTGKDVILNDSFNPNDSACILKEYLRSLPEPLLTRDLYSSFLATCKIKEADKRLQAVRYLICLLPVPNRDTLEVLLKLLDKVKANANNEPDTKRSGNKMDSFNLAMVFGPNILKKHKLGSSTSSGKLNDYSSDKYNLIDDIDSVISTTKYLIENQDSLFHIESCLHNELIQTINNLNPNELNAILTRKIVSSIGINKQDNNQLILNDNSDTSGYSSSVKSQLAKSNTDDSLSPMNCLSNSSSNELVTKNQYFNADFIDYNLTKHRTSRTKLHKISDNFTYLHSKESEPITFVHSPSHSPTRCVPKPPKRVQSQSNQIMKTFANEIYNNQIIESYLNPTTKSIQKPSSLLLMIQSNESKSNKLKQKTENLNNDLLSKATKSLSNLNQQQTQLALDKRRQSGPQNTAGKQPQYKVVNSNTIQICSKFYDKSKYNIIGEQETLV